MCHRVHAPLWLGCALLLAGCSGEAPTAGAPSHTEQPLPTLRAETLTLALGPWPTIVRTQGSLSADEVSVVGAKVSGRIDQVFVDLGDAVKQNQPLVVLDLNDFKQEVQQADMQLNQARSAVGLREGMSVDTLDPLNAPPVRQERATWDQAKANLERGRQLRKQNAVSEAEIVQLEAAERVAEARYASAVNGVYEKIALIGVQSATLELAKQRLADAEIKAPFDGLVQSRHVAPGAFVSVGQQIVTIVRASVLRFRSAMPERHAQHLAIGQEVQLEIESVSKPRLAHVTRISPALDESTRSLWFEAEVDNADGALRAGLFAEAEVVLDSESEALVLPRSAIREFAGSENVWKIVDGVAREVTIETGQRRPEGIEVRAGLKPGDQVLRDAEQGQVARIEAVPAAKSAQASTSDTPGEAAEDGTAEQ